MLRIGSPIDAGYSKESYLPSSKVVGADTPVDIANERRDVNKSGPQGAISDALYERLIKANEQLSQHGVALSFSYDQQTGVVTLSVVDQLTDTVLLQIPRPSMIAVNDSRASLGGRGALVDAST